MELIQTILMDLVIIRIYLLCEKYRKGSKTKRNKRVNEKEKGGGL